MIFNYIKLLAIIKCLEISFLQKKTIGLRTFHLVLLCEGCRTSNVTEIDVKQTFYLSAFWLLRSGYNRIQIHSFRFSYLHSL